MKLFLLAAAWPPVLAGLYLPLVALEFYWNIPDWQPRFNAYALLFAWWVFGCSVLTSLLVFVTSRNNLGRAFSLLVSATLLALGIYLLPPEPLSSGLLGRELSSPLWYRGSRAALLSLPALLWVIRLLRD